MYAVTKIISNEEVAGILRQLTYKNANKTYRDLRPARLSENTKDFVYICAGFIPVLPQGTANMAGFQKLSSF